MPPQLYPHAEDTARERPEQGARSRSWSIPGNTGAESESWGTRPLSGYYCYFLFPHKEETEAPREGIGFTGDHVACISGWGTRSPWQQDLQIAGAQLESSPRKWESVASIFFSFAQHLAYLSSGLGTDR